MTTTDALSEAPDRRAASQRATKETTVEAALRVDGTGVVDVHTGYPYSDVDVLQNYVGEPNTRRFPTFFSLDARIYRDFPLVMPFIGHSTKRKLRLGVYSLNLTNHLNPHDVFNNVTSPLFGQFAGFQHRVDGFVIDLIN